MPREVIENDSVAGEDAPDTNAAEQVETIDDMLESVEGPTAVGEKPPAVIKEHEPEVEPEAEPAQEEVVDEPAVEEELAVEAEPAPDDTDVPAVEDAITEPVDADELAAMRQEMNNMAAMLNRFNVSPEQVLPDAGPTSEQTGTDGVQAPPAQEEDAPVIPFVTDENLVEVLESADGVNGLLTQAGRTTREWMLRQMPTMMQTYVQGQMETERAISDFYDRNEDLREFKPLVAAIAQKFENSEEYAGKPVADILAVTEKETRKALRLPSKSGTKEVTTRKPALPGKTGKASTTQRARPPARKPSADSDLSDMLDFAESEHMLRDQ